MAAPMAMELNEKELKEKDLMMEKKKDLMIEKKKDLKESGEPGSASAIIPMMGRSRTFLQPLSELVGAGGQIDWSLNHILGLFLYIMRGKEIYVQRPMFMLCTVADGAFVPGPNVPPVVSWKTLYDLLIPNDKRLVLIRPVGNGTGFIHAPDRFEEDPGPTELFQWFVAHEDLTTAPRDQLTRKYIQENYVCDCPRNHYYVHPVYAYFSYTPNKQVSTINTADVCV